MSSKVKCTCGWSWNKSDSSKKDMYICHECGRDNSNNMKNGGWLDQYADGGTMQEHQENYNDYKVSAPEGFKGTGYSNVGRNYSPAWGGQFQMGGNLPGTNLNVFDNMMGGQNNSQYETYGEDAATNLNTFNPHYTRINDSNNNNNNNIDYSRRPGPDAQPYYESNYGESDRGYMPWHNTQGMPLEMSFQEISNTPIFKYLKENIETNPFFKMRLEDNPYYRLNTPDKNINYNTSSNYSNSEPSIVDEKNISPSWNIKQNNRRLEGRGGTYDDVNTTTDDINVVEQAKHKADIFNKSIEEKYGNSPNPKAQERARILRNDVEITPNYQMGGNVYPVNYVPQAAMGASMPGSVGFTYARTKGIPSEGPYAKKTMPSAQPGKKIKIKDERGQAMKTSESTAVKRKDFDLMQSKDNKAYLNQVIAQKKEAARRSKLTKDQREREDYNARNEQTGSIQTPVEESTWDRTKAIASNPLTAFGYAARNESLPARFQYGERNALDTPIDFINPLQGAAALSEIPGELGRGEYLNAGLSALDAADLGVYAKGAMKASKPFLQKGVQQLRNIPTSIAPELRQGLRTAGPSFDDLPKELEPYISKKVFNDNPEQRIFESSFQPEQRNKLLEQRTKYYDSKGNEIPKPERFLKQGGIIKDDMGQWNHPGEITEIDSPYITMQGVPYPVLGISDTGDTQMMYPEEEYEFDGEKVTEYPMARNGRRQEQKGLVNLDQLTNFTNYNKPQPGGWLNKYN